MKKFFLLGITAVFLINLQCYATIRRVGYSGPQLSGTDYADVATAVTASAANDTIQLYPNASAYTLNTLSKPLVFIGAGYFLSQNTGLQLSTTEATLTISSALTSGSSGSTFEGITLNGTYLNPTASLGLLQNVTFKRCKITSAQYVYAGSANDSIKNITYSQCYFASSIQITTAGTNSGIRNVFFNNCIFNDSYNDNFSVTGTGSGIANFVFYNCNFSSSSYSGLPATASLYFRNCIIVTEPTATNNNLFDYCTFVTNNATHYISGTGNQYGKTLASIYTAGTNATSTANGWDAGCKLVAGSPCLGFGRDYSNATIDAGAYGSADPYKLSGIPPVPAFYQLTSTSTSATSNPYQINFSVRANN